MIDTALPYLAAFENLTPLTRMDVLVESWPAHVRNVNLYLRSLIGTEHEQAVVDTIVAVLTTQRLVLPWVQGWLIDVLARCSRSEEVFAAWLQETAFASSAPWFVRGRALIALARTDAAFPVQSDVAELFEAASPAARPDIVAAVHLANTDLSGEFVATLAAGEVILKETVAMLMLEPIESVL